MAKYELEQNMGKCVKLLQPLKIEKWQRDQSEKMILEVMIAEQTYPPRPYQRICAREFARELNYPITKQEMEIQMRMLPSEQRERITGVITKSSPVVVSIEQSAERTAKNKAEARSTANKVNIDYLHIIDKLGEYVTIANIARGDLSPLTKWGIWQIAMGEALRRTGLDDEKIPGTDITWGDGNKYFGRALLAGSIAKHIPPTAWLVIGALAIPVGIAYLTKKQIDNMTPEELDQYMMKAGGQVGASYNYLKSVKKIQAKLQEKSEAKTELLTKPSKEIDYSKVIKLDLVEEYKPRLTIKDLNYHPTARLTGSSAIQVKSSSANSPELVPKKLGLTTIASQQQAKPMVTYKVQPVYLPNPAGDITASDEYIDLMKEVAMREFGIAYQTAAAPAWADTEDDAGINNFISELEIRVAEALSGNLIGGSA